MSLNKQFKVDAKKAEEGVVIEYAPNEDGTTPSFRILRSSPTNQKYASAITRETVQYRRQIELGSLDSRTSQRVWMKIFCTGVLVSWDNVQDETGKPIPYNLENAMKLFESLPDLYDDLSAQSAKLSLFRESDQEAAAKN